MFLRRHAPKGRTDQPTALPQTPTPRRGQTNQPHGIALRHPEGAKRISLTALPWDSDAPKGPNKSAQGNALGRGAHRRVKP